MNTLLDTLLTHAPGILTGIAVGALGTWLKLKGRSPVGANRLRAVGKKS